MSAGSLTLARARPAMKVMMNRSEKLCSVRLIFSTGVGSMDDFSFLGTGTAPRQGLPLSGRLIGSDTPWLRVNSVDIFPRLLFARRNFSRTLNIHRRNGVGAPETI